VTRDPLQPIVAALEELGTDRDSEAAWRVIVKYTSTVVRALGAFRLHVAPHDLDDVTAEVMYRLVRWAPFREFGGDEVRFRAYVSAVARSIVTANARRQKRYQQMEDELADDPTLVSKAVFQDDAVLNELLTRLLDVLKPQELRLVHRLASGASREEIAKEMKLTAGAFAVRLFRLRHKVRKWLIDNDL